MNSISVKKSRFESLVYIPLTFLALFHQIKAIYGNQAIVYFFGITILIVLINYIFTRKETICYDDGILYIGLGS